MPLADLLIVLFYLALFAGIISILYFERKGFVISMPVMPWVYGRVKKLLLAHTDTTKPYRIAELGSGWGGPLLSLARSYKQAELTGYEISPVPYFISKLRTFFHRRIKIFNANFFGVDLSGFDIIYCYLLPRDLEALKPAFLTMKKGSLVVSCSFPVEGWQTIEADNVKAGVNVPVFLYRI
ncbi:MAG: hypothetical protein GC136_04585 [Alphaproteobacteria bacterium]|nr:hypothetical protein [Alphaproteobacteria bacterium]